MHFPEILAGEEWGAILRRHGFERGASGWSGGAISFRRDGGWLVFEAAGAGTEDPWAGQLQKPGLWKAVQVGGEWRRIFSVPATALGSEDRSGVEEEDKSAFEQLLVWALATVGGHGPDGWRVPERTLIDSCLEKSRLTLVQGAFTRQVQVQVQVQVRVPEGPGQEQEGAGRLALRLPIVPSLPKTMPEGRRRWLRALMCEAQSGHHLFRLRIVDEGGQPALVAETDLTGVPRVLLEPLLSTSLDALRWVAAWLIEAADFLAQPATVSRALEICALPEPNP